MRCDHQPIPIAIDPYAAIATVAAYGSMAVGMGGWSQRIYPVPYQWRRVATAALAAVALAAIAGIVDAGLLGAFALIAAYPFALLALGFTSPVERRRLRALVTQRGA